jgi:hypothetical protein
MMTVLAAVAQFERGLIPIQCLERSLAPTQFGDNVLAAQPAKTMRIFPSAENWRRVARRNSFTSRPASSFTDPDLNPIFARRR